MNALSLVMLTTCKIRQFWSQGSNLHGILNESAVLLYVHHNKDSVYHSNTFPDKFIKNDKVNNIISQYRISCFKRHILDMTNDDITRLEIANIPSIISIHMNNKVSEINKSTCESNYEQFCMQLVAMNNLASSSNALYHDAIDKAIKSGNIQEILNLIEKYSSNQDYKLQAKLAIAKLHVLNRNKLDLDTLKSNLMLINNLLEKCKKLSFEKATAKFQNKYNLSDTEKHIQVEFKSLCSALDYNGENVKDNLQKQCTRLKVILLNSLAVSFGVQQQYENGIKNALDAYKIAIQTNLCFRDTSEILKLFIDIQGPTSQIILDAISEIANINGPRLTNPIYPSKRPLGGVTQKRRGFGGRYIWQGLDYRPKRYKPKDFDLYKNEWQCIQDSNVPIY